MTPTGDSMGASRNDADRADRAWMRDEAAKAVTARPHSTTVVWAQPDRGAPQFAALCATCGQVAVSPSALIANERKQAHEAMA